MRAQDRGSDIVARSAMTTSVACAMAAIAVGLAFIAVPHHAHAQQATRDDARFVASSQGEVYYWIGCDNWRRLSRRNLRFFRNASDAQSAGYRPSRARGWAPQLDTALITPTPNGNAQCVVARIVDGDTFQCEGGSRVRLLIADADEIGQSIYADSAAALLERLMPVGSTVHLEFDLDGHDRYDRLLAHVYAGGGAGGGAGAGAAGAAAAGAVYINRALLRRGFARVALYMPNVKHVEVLRAARDSARAERLGVWSSSAFACAPAAYRRDGCG